MKDNQPLSRLQKFLTEKLKAFYSINFQTGKPYDLIYDNIMTSLEK